MRTKVVSPLATTAFDRVCFFIAYLQLLMSKQTGTDSPKKHGAWTEQQQHLIGFGQEMDNNYGSSRRIHSKLCNEWRQSVKVVAFSDAQDTLPGMPTKQKPVIQRTRIDKTVPASNKSRPMRASAARLLKFKAVFRAYGRSGFRA